MLELKTSSTPKNTVHKYKKKIYIWKNKIKFMCLRSNFNFSAIKTHPVSPPSPSPSTFSPAAPCAVRSKRAETTWRGGAEDTCARAYMHMNMNMIKCTCRDGWAYDQIDQIYKCTCKDGWAHNQLKTHSYLTHTSIYFIVLKLSLEKTKKTQK